MGNSDSIPGYMLKYLVMAVVGVVVVGVLFQLNVATGATEAVEYPGDTFNELDDGYIDEVPSDVTVRATTGHAVGLETASFEADAPPALDNGSWSVCAVPALSDDASVNATYTILGHGDGDLVMQYDAGSWAVYHNTSAGDALASVQAQDPRALTPVCSRYNAGSQTLSVQTGEAYDSAQVDAGTEARNVSLDWSGRLDEVRVFGAAEDNATLQAFVDDPVEPRPGADRAARWMFDEGSGTSTYGYFVDSSSQLPAGSYWTDGVQGPTGLLGGSAIDEGDDYEVRGDSFSVRVVEGGYLDGAPVIHVSWDEPGFIPFEVGAMMSLFVALILLAEIANRVTSMMGGGRY